MADLALNSIPMLRDNSIELLCKVERLYFDFRHFAKL